MLWIVKIPFMKGTDMKMSWLVMAVAALTLAAAPAVAAPEGEWLTSYDAAKAAAQKSGKPILVNFSGSDWCGWCIKLDKEVFSTPEFKAWAEKNVVLMVADFPRRKTVDPATKAVNEELMKQHGVRGFPTILFLTADGAKIGQSGYKPGGPKAWTEDAQKILDAKKGK